MLAIISAIFYGATIEDGQDVGGGRLCMDEQNPFILSNLSDAARPVGTRNPFEVLYSCYRKKANKMLVIGQTSAIVKEGTEKRKSRFELYMTDGYQSLFFFSLESYSC